MALLDAALQLGERCLEGRVAPALAGDDLPGERWGIEGKVRAKLRLGTFHGSVLCSWSLAKPPCASTMGPQALLEAHLRGARSGRCDGGGSRWGRSRALVVGVSLAARGGQQAELTLVHDGEGVLLEQVTRDVNTLPCVAARHLVGQRAVADDIVGADQPFEALEKTAPQLCRLERELQGTRVGIPALLGAFSLVCLVRTEVILLAHPVR